VHHRTSPSTSPSYAVTPEMQQDQIHALKRFNLGKDCPVFDGLYGFC
jgi:histone deacetylase 1/2